MKTLVFGEGLLAPTMAGAKRITLRSYRPGAHDFTQGELLIGEFKEGLHLLLRATAGTELVRAGELSDSVAQADGFRDRQHAIVGLKAYYPKLTTRSQLAIIRYEMVCVGGAPMLAWPDWTAPRTVDEAQALLFGASEVA